MSEYWLISILNEGEPTPGDDQATRESVDKLKGSLSTLAEVHRFEIPDLRVGTLEKLMGAGDLLQKVDNNVEGVVRKIERQFAELNDNKETLGVDQMPARKFLENFKWNAAKYPTQRSVDELIRNIVQSANKTEIELKESGAFFQEKRNKHQALERQKEGNLFSGNLDEVLTPNITPEDIKDSEYLKTVVVVVGKQNLNHFLETYQDIGETLVGYGPEEDPESVKGSPVVPGSAQHVISDDSGSLYLVTILRKFHEEFKTAAQTQHNKYLVREYDFEASYEAYQRLKLEGDNVDALTLAANELKEARFQLVQWCKTHYGDAFVAWIHIKAIRLFVESVLRYGLPVNFAAAIVKPLKKGNEKRAREKLSRLYASLDTSGLMQMHADEAALGGEETFPYVSYTIEPEKEK